MLKTDLPELGDSSNSVVLRLWSWPPPPAAPAVSASPENLLERQILGLYSGPVPSETLSTGPWDLCYKGVFEMQNTITGVSYNSSGCVVSFRIFAKVPHPHHPPRG